MERPPPGKWDLRLPTCPAPPQRAGAIARGYAPGNAGANAGANASGVSSADMSRMQDMLTPGQAAFVLVVDDPYGKDLQTALQGDKGTGGLVIQLAPH